MLKTSMNKFNENIVVDIWSHYSLIASPYL